MQNYALIVDDDHFSVYYIEQVLRPIGIQLLKAEDGAQALQMLESYTPSIVFLDMLLPRVSGIELLDFIKKTPRLNVTYVAVVSAHNHFPASPQLSRVDAYFVKPVPPQTIRDAARHAIERPALT